MTQVMRAIIAETKNQGLTQSALSRLSGITPQTMSKYFNGINDPSIGSASLMAEALGMVITIKKGREDDSIGISGRG